MSKTSYQLIKEILNLKQRTHVAALMPKSSVMEIFRNPELMKMTKLNPEELAQIGTKIVRRVPPPPPKPIPFDLDQHNAIRSFWSDS